MMLERLVTDIIAAGLAFRGAFHPDDGDAAPATTSGAAVATLVLVGFVGRRGWEDFARSAEFADGTADPLDRWSRRTVGALAVAHDATAFYPFGGPPFLPFGAWARRAEPVYPSPLGLLIHPDWGLWHSYRGALGFAGRLDLPRPDRRPSPCNTCSTRPCLDACPVGAFTPGHYAVARCTSHLDATAGAGCREAGCLARRACPIGDDARHDPAQAAFHLRAFRRAQPR